IPTRRTHQARASLRLRATPPATSVSRIERSFMRRRVMTGTLRVVKILASSPHRAPQATLRPNWRSASRAIRILSSRVSSRKRSILARRAAARPDLAVPPASSASGRVPMTRISSPSAVTSGGPRNQPDGTRAANQATTSSATDYKITSQALGLSPSGSGGRDRRSGGQDRLLRSLADELDHLDDHLGAVALLARGVLPGAGVQPALGVDRAAFLQVLAGELGERAEHDQVVELSQLLAGAGLIIASVVVRRPRTIGVVRALARLLDVKARTVMR